MKLTRAVQVLKPRPPCPKPHAQLPRAHAPYPKSLRPQLQRSTTLLGTSRASRASHTRIRTSARTRLASTHPQDLWACPLCPAPTAQPWGRSCSDEPMPYEVKPPTTTHPHPFRTAVNPTPCTCKRLRAYNVEAVDGCQKHKYCATLTS